MIQSCKLLICFCIGRLRNKKELTAVNRDRQDELPRISMSRHTNTPRNIEKSSMQVSGVIQSMVTKKISQDFSRSESWVLAALSDLEEFTLNSRVLLQSRNVPGTSRMLKAKTKTRRGPFPEGPSSWSRANKEEVFSHSDPWVLHFTDGIVRKTETFTSVV